MTRAAVREGFEQFVEDAIDVTAEQFDVRRALRRGVSGPGASVVDRLLGNSATVRRRVVEPELADYRHQILSQFDAILDYAESEGDIEAFRETILERDPFARAIRADIPPARRAAIHDTLLERHRKLGDAVVPLVDSPETDFWAAASSALDRATVEELIEQRFVFTEPIQEYTDALAMTTSVDPGDVLDGLGGLFGSRLPTVSVEYTNEAVRAMGKAEQVVIADAREEINRRFPPSEGV